MCVFRIFLFLTNKWCQWEGRVATGMLSAPAAARRWRGIILLCVHVYHAPVVSSPVITAADKFSLEASEREKREILMTEVVAIISVCGRISIRRKATRSGS